jgi:hypothetical protein
MIGEIRRIGSNHESNGGRGYPTHGSMLNMVITQSNSRGGPNTSSPEGSTQNDHNTAVDSNPFKRWAMDEIH